MSVNSLILSSSPAPTLISAAGDHAAYRFLEFFPAQIRNPHTRRAYVWAVGRCAHWNGVKQPTRTDHG